MRITSVFAAASIAVMLSMAVALPASAADTAQQSTMKTCAASWSAKSAADKAKAKYKDYMSTCLKTPTAAAAPAPAPVAMKAAAKPAPAMAMKAATGGGSAKCKDGTTVTYKNRSGTCSGHKGVATWL